MIKKIRQEIEEFVGDIKDVENCDKLLGHMNKGVYSSIQLLMAVSKNFSVYGRVFLFLIISVTGFMMLSTTGTTPFNIAYLAILDLILLILALRFIMHFKRLLFSSIDDKKIQIAQSGNSEE